MLIYYFFFPVISESVRDRVCVRRIFKYVPTVFFIFLKQPPTYHPLPFPCAYPRAAAESLSDLTSVCRWCARVFQRRSSADRAALCACPPYQCRVVTARTYVYIAFILSNAPPPPARRPRRPLCSAPAAAVVRRFSAELGTPLGARRPVPFRTRSVRARRVRRRRRRVPPPPPPSAMPATGFANQEPEQPVVVHKAQHDLFESE